MWCLSFVLDLGYFPQSSSWASRYYHRWLELHMAACAGIVKVSGCKEHLQFDRIIRRFYQKSIFCFMLEIKCQIRFSYMYFRLRTITSGSSGRRKKTIITITIVIIIITFNITIVIIIIIVTITAIAITFCHHNHGATVQGCFSSEFDLLCAATSAEF